MAKTPPKIDITKHPEFRVAHINGVFGAIKADEGFMKFYLDIVEPRIKVGGKPGQMEMDRITRELQFEVRMTVPQFVSIAGWMQAHIKELEKKGILKKVKKKTEKATETYRV